MNAYAYAHATVSRNLKVLFRSENKSMTEKYIVNNAFNMYVCIYSTQMWDDCIQKQRAKNMKHSAVVQVGL